MKIPTLFARDPEDRRHVTDTITPGCEWVSAGEGIPTRQWNGTCVRLDDNGAWWARREVKPGRPTPAGFVASDHDDATGKTVGWEPVFQSPFLKFWDEAFCRQRGTGAGLQPGTFELVGPKINGNPEGFEAHTLIPHGWTATLEYELLESVGRDFASLKAFLTEPPPLLAGLKGIVWHGPEGRMAKIKARDFA